MDYRKGLGAAIAVQLCLALALAFCAVLVPQKALAAENGDFGRQGTLTAQASYPSLYLMFPSLESMMKSPQTELEFTYKFYSGYNNNKASLEVRRDSPTGPVVATWPEVTFTAWNGTFTNSDLTLKVDASSFEPGIYYVVKNLYFYSLNRWNESPRNPSADIFKIVGTSKSGRYGLSSGGSAVSIKCSKLTIKRGKSKKIAYSPKSGITLKKTKGNKKITVSKKGKVKVSKKLKKGKYKITVKAYKGALVVAKKKITIKVK